MFGGWAIDKELFDTIRGLLPDGSTILELGSGDGTSELVKHYKVTSIEHNIRFLVTRGVNHHLYYAPLVNGWYSPKAVEEALKNVIPDLLLVDGPPGESRSGMQRQYHLFDHLDCPVIFDDVNRSFDRDNMLAWCRRFNYSHSFAAGKYKTFAVCLKRA